MKPTETIERIQAHLEDRLPQALEILRQMVSVNSFTANAAGVNSLGELTAAVFARLGFWAEFVQSENSAYGRHLFLHRAGAGGGLAGAVGMVAHLDTVFPPEEEARHDFAWRPDGNRIYGPGTVDIKGGTVMIYLVLEALQACARDVFEATPWLVALNASEETLGDDFARLCRERLPQDARACLVFEGGTVSKKGWPVVVSRKGRATYRVRVEGKSAHAGNYHANGANAIVELARATLKIAALTDYEQALTFNVGVVSGGSVVNRVPHAAEAHVEMRAFHPAVFEQGVAAMLALNGDSESASADGYRCKVRMALEEQTAPWPENEGTQRLFAVWQSAAQTLGLTLLPEKRGGLSDGNLLWAHFPTLDGLGPSGDNAHCSERSADGGKDQEYVLATSFVPKALLNTLAILDLVEAGGH
ncbi:MAG: M20/M25/M40 family metallo-hydrolase [Chloroflexi bacterium]|nr:M20/M25/M40 family metallo-hydrolase [Chloroflexota bacterium]